jgi:hypothetical protein
MPSSTTVPRVVVSHADDDSEHEWLPRLTLGGDGSAHVGWRDHALLLPLERALASSGSDVGARQCVSVALAGEALMAVGSVSGATGARASRALLLTRSAALCVELPRNLAVARTAPSITPRPSSLALHASATSTVASSSGIDELLSAVRAGDNARSARALAAISSRATSREVQRRVRTLSHRVAGVGCAVCVGESRAARCTTSHAAAVGNAGVLHVYVRIAS